MGVIQRHSSGFGLWNGDGRDDVAALERDMESRLGVLHAIAMPLARVGIYLTIKHIVRPGQTVLMSPYTIADVVNMVVCAGARPVFVDIDRESCNMSAASLSELIDDQSAAVLVTHFYGQVANLNEIMAIADRHGLPVIEDSAQCFGGLHGGRPTGTIGRAGVYGFGMYKNVNAYYGVTLPLQRSGF